MDTLCNELLAEKIQGFVNYWGVKTGKTSEYER